MTEASLHREARPETRQTPLPEGAAEGGLLFVDAFAGVSGPAIVGALLDLGVPFLVVERAVGALSLESVFPRRGAAQHSGVFATTFETEAKREPSGWSSDEARALLATSLLPRDVRTLAGAMLERLARAKAAVAGSTPDRFRSCSGATLVEIVSAAACLVHMGGEVVVSPVAIGVAPSEDASDRERSRWEIVQACSGGAPRQHVPSTAALTTPVGAAIVAASASRFARWPAMRPARTGWGAGRGELRDRPNLLRIVLGF